jgi:hypothetical protein
MRRYRQRKRAAGLRQERRWVRADGEAEGGPYSDHSIREARSLAMHCLIARKVSRSPELIEVARRNLAAWRQARSAAERPRWMDEWDSILRRPWPQIAALLTSTSQKAARLRQSSPFAGVLDPAERRRVYDAFRA